MEPARLFPASAVSPRDFEPASVGVCQPVVVRMGVIGECVWLMSGSVASEGARALLRRHCSVLLQQATGAVWAPSRERGLVVVSVSACVFPICWPNAWLAPHLFPLPATQQIVHTKAM